MHAEQQAAYATMHDIRFVNGSTAIIDKIWYDKDHPERSTICFSKRTSRRHTESQHRGAIRTGRPKASAFRSTSQTI